jgi:hypothetical protein
MKLTPEEKAELAAMKAKENAIKKKAKKRAEQEIEDARPKTLDERIEAYTKDCAYNGKGSVAAFIKESKRHPKVLNQIRNETSLNIAGKIKKI